MKPTTSRLNIVFASQTGTAEDVARRIYRQAKRRRLNTQCSSIEEFPIFELTDEPYYVVFIISTCGQGEMPDSLQKTWMLLLRKQLPPTLLDNLNFAILGLGDASYSKFNFAAKKLYRRLLQLGAKSFAALGLADDQHEFGADSVAEQWINDFWLSLKRVWPFSMDGISAIADRLPSAYRISSVNNGAYGSAQEVHPPWEAVEVLQNDRLTPEGHFQETRLVKVSCGNLVYRPGDVVVVRPRNLQENMDLFMQICTHIKYESPFILDMAPGELCNAIFPLKQCQNFKFYLENYFDLQATPKRTFFEILAEFAVDEREQEKLLEFSSAVHLDDFLDYCIRPRRTIVETLLDFPNTVKLIPLNYWFDLLPIIRPRSFSIASSPDLHSGQIHILLAVVRYKAPVLVKPRLGLCSNYLARQKPGSTICVTVKKGSLVFHSTEIAQRPPYIMIGPGTGVAPFRSFSNSRLFHFQNHDKKLALDYLLFGCRNERADFYFEQEWTTMSHILKLFTAFSRDQDKKIYVQNRIKEHADLMADLVFNRGAWIFIAGNAKQMPDNVIDAIKYCLLKSGLLSEQNIDNYIAALEKSNRLQTETWS